MINFIVCEDNPVFLEKNINTINKVMFSNNVEYKIYPFNKYNNELQNLICNNFEIKIYILDIELDDISGIDIARKIRKSDWNSIIVFSTAHFELFPQVFSDKLMIFDYISKYDNYDNNLRDTLNKIIDIIDKNKILKIKSESHFYNINFNSILYIIYDKSIRKTIIKTTDKEYFVNDTLKSILLKLNNNFIRINRSCILNKNNVKCLKIKDKEVEFFNGVVLEDVLINKESA